MNAPRAGILVVDDTPSNIDVLKNMLVTHGYQVKAATSGEMALRVARKLPPPELILLDVVMPVLDGYEVCRQLKTDPLTSDIPVVFVTAAASDDEVQRGMLLGAAGFLFKPLEIALTLETVKLAIAERGHR